MGVLALSPRRPRMHPTVEQLLALPRLQRQVLEALAVFDDDITRTDLARVMGALGVRVGRRAISGATLKAPLRALVDAGLAVETGRYRIAEGSAEPIIRHLHGEGRYETVAAAADTVEAVEPGTFYWGRGRTGAIYRALRRCLYRGEADAFFQLYQTLERVSGFTNIPMPPVVSWVIAPLDSALLRALPVELAGLLLGGVVNHQLHAMTPIEGLRPLVQEHVKQHPDDPHLQTTLFQEALLSGELERARTMTLDPYDLASPALLGLQALIEGDLKASAKRYAAARAAFKKEGFDFVPGLAGMFLPLAYLLEGSKTRVKQASALLRTHLDRWDYSFEVMGHGYTHLGELARMLHGEEYTPGEESLHPAAVLLEGLVAHWADEPLQEKSLRAAQAESAACGYRWMSAELGALLGDEPVPGARALVSHREATPAWAQRLELLEAAVKPARAARASKEVRGPRVAWLLTHTAHYTDIEPREQVPKGRGWSKGRKIALKRLKENPGGVKGMTDRDRVVATCLHIHTTRSWRGYPETEYSWNTDKLWPALVGHPAVFSASDPNQSLEITLRQPTVEVREAGGRLALRLQPPLGDGAVGVREVPGGYEVTAFSKAQKQLAALVGGGLEVPADQRERLGAVVARLAATFPVHDKAAVAEASARAVDADPAPIVRLTPAGEGVAARLLVRPLGDDGPECSPGAGAALVLAQVGDEVLSTRRPLKKERSLMAALDAAAPTLPAAREGEEPLDLEASLTLLTELAAAGDEVRVEWPEGQHLRLRREVDASALSLSIKADSDWFAASGKLTVDEGLVLQLTALLALVEATPGRFLRLEGGDFLALTDQLRARLDTLARVSRSARGQARFHRLAAGAVAPLVDEVGRRRADKAWKGWRERLSAPPTDPTTPRTLQAELRPYQRDGFTWMTRLAALGAGACLADDMGLGKTVQSLALLLHRAAEGPALVVAPTSVCGVWIREAWRFAPALKVLRFGDGDRQTMLDGLGPADVVVCSYGLLQTESERLSAVRWSTAILDEAQAIKNPNTKRHKAALALKADFRLATTGTPVENHLGELWSLFAFLNPGLLGGRDTFHRRYVAPIEGGERAVQAQLRRLVLPFILRRTKSAVLDDLPPRIDIEVPITPGPEEAALYEALRLRAVEALTGDEDGAKPLQVLAQLTRLRMACCNPRLVLEESQPAPPSAKLEAFAEIVEGLREGNHRALVFSQFVRHLSLLREWLDAQAIPYQYLDGSTPAAERDRRVRAFQTGEGDLFLISLRAGGFGLNLTAADYVVHMDPWWNPAVEDQASDRAHRIGQTRPVTVYRMVTQGTIEEKILALHRQKRDIADRLLADADTSARLTAEELIALLISGSDPSA